MGRPRPRNSISSATEQKGRRPLRLLALLAVLAALLAAVFVLHRVTRGDRLLRQARNALQAGDLRRARGLAMAVAQQSPESKEAHLVAGQAAAAMQDFDNAMNSLQQVANDGSPAAVEARMLEGVLLLMQFRRLSAAERQFRRAIEQDPDKLQARDNLAFVLGVGARPWEQIPHRLRLIEADQFQMPHLHSLALGRSAMENDDLADDFHRSQRDDPAPLLMLARLAIESQDYPRAESLLRRAIGLDSQLTEAHVKLGRVLLQQDSLDAMPAWNAALPPEAGEHPDVWAVRGEWARRVGSAEQAARCFWEAVRRNPEHDLAVYQLGRQLVELGRTEDAAPFLQRAEKLQQYINAATSASEQPRPELFQTAARLAEQLGLAWEAYAWNRLLLNERPTDREVEQKCLQLRSQFEPVSSVRSLAAANPARQLDLASLPLPQWAAATSDGLPSGEAAALPTLADEAQRAGIDFQYVNGGEPARMIAYMQEFSGGGVAAVDYDADGWPDLYLSQGCQWGEQGRQSEHLDRLYRNRGDGGFEEVSEAAGLRQNGFGQGVAAGDFDNDGFADLFVSNIGGNRLLQNNGDGTFRDVTQRAGAAGDRWSTSAAVADFNGDGLPDLYSVSYLGGANVFTQQCGGISGPGACFPQFFPAAQDELYVNQGDGAFGNATAESGIVADNGKGLGIVVADLEQNGRLSVFVANDTESNFLFVNQSQPGGPPVFRDEAVLRGVAMSESGKLEACMGVAAGDIDENGLIDLFVTNFYDESNTLYAQQSGGLFADRTARARLRDPSTKLLGFGTQLVDFDLDGRLDLFVANGHIGNRHSQAIPYQMPPQVFQNIGQGRFREPPAAEVGAYLTGEYLGRAVARLDWNRDGAEDLAVGHLDAPLALLTNTTRPRGRHVAVHLRATRSARDAIGATLRATIGGRRLVRQLTAGDGYQCSNQRRLVFGLGEAPRIDSLQVAWPSGAEQTFSNLDADAELLIVEGCQRPLPIGGR